MVHWQIAILLFTLLAGFASCKRPPHNSEQAAPPGAEVPIYTFEVVASFPHDPAAYTQGLIYYNGALFESTGLQGFSSFRMVEIETGRVLKKVEVPQEYFAEGLTIFQGRVFQLTWQSRKGFIYDLGTFALTGEFSYDGEGWGLTHDHQFLIMSDGTHRLRFLNPASFKTERTISVFDGDRPVVNLNELEYIKGEIYANVWQTDRIVRLDPKTGSISGWIDLAGLLPPAGRSPNTDNVLNGIAYDEAGDRLFVTGKRWPKLFQIRLKRK